MAFSLTIVDLRTNTRISRSVAIPRIRVTTRIRDSVADSLMILGRQVRRNFSKSTLQSQFYVPGWLRPVAAIHVMADGTIWLRPETGKRTKEAAWLVLDSLGHDLARLSLPSDVKPFESRGDLMWAFHYTEDDIPEIERYRLIKH